MNLLEHYILEVIEVKPYVSKTKMFKDNGEKCVEVTLKVDCYGRIETRTRVFWEDDWEKAQRDGFYMA